MISEAWLGFRDFSFIGNPIECPTGNTEEFGCLLASEQLMQGGAGIVGFLLDEQGEAVADGGVLALELVEPLQIGICFQFFHAANINTLFRTFKLIRTLCALYAVDIDKYQSSHNFAFSKIRIIFAMPLRILRKYPQS